MNKKHTKPVMNELYRIGRLIRNTRRRVKNPIQKLADEVNLTSDQWRALELGKLKLSFSTLSSILNLLGLPLPTVFNSKKDDFFPFVRLCMGKDPIGLTDEEADEIYDLYLELHEFRQKRSKSTDQSRANADETEV